MAISNLLNVTLRRATSDDGELFERWRNQPSSTEFQASPKRDLNQLRAMLAEQEDIQLGSKVVGRFYWICKLEGIPVAQVQIAVDERDRKQDSATLGYIVDEDFHGRGIATACVRAVVPVAFDPRGLQIERIEAVAAVGNVASQRVLEKAGFQFEGIQRGLLVIRGVRVDHACYAMLNTDFGAGEQT